MSPIFKMLEPVYVKIQPKKENCSIKDKKNPSTKFGRGIF
jgi:hypothetical protein